MDCIDCLSVLASYTVVTECSVNIGWPAHETHLKLTRHTHNAHMMLTKGNDV